MIELYLIRHARAAERGSSYPDDSKRPLVTKGHTQAKTLAKLFEHMHIQFDHLFSSPYTRAAQTAEPLAQRLKKGKHIQYLDALARDNYSHLLAELKAWTQTSGQCIGLVGHEPYIGELASYLLSDTKRDIAISFKKSTFMCLQGELEPASMSLAAFIPFYWYKQLS